MLRDLSTFELIGQRYLDSWHEAAYVQQLELELKARGVIGVRRWLYEYAAASGLWWNVLWWEWIRLDGNDVRRGWIHNIVLLCILGLVASYFGGPLAAAIAVIAGHAATVAIGLELRKGTLPPENGNAI